MSTTQLAQFGHPTHFARNPASKEQRLAGIVFVAAIHVVIAYGFLSFTGFLPVPHTVGDIAARFIPDLPVDATPPPPPLPVVTPPVIDVPPVIELPIEVIPPQPNAITPPETIPPVASVLPPANPPGPAAITRPAVAIAATHTTPDYPPVSRRLGEQGTLQLRLAIGIEGAVKDASVVRSSGFPRLDAAAVDWVKGHWRYQPAVQFGKAVPSTADAVVTFRLQ